MALLSITTKGRSANVDSNLDKHLAPAYCCFARRFHHIANLSTCCDRFCLPWRVTRKYFYTH